MRPSRAGRRRVAGIVAVISLLLAVLSGWLAAARAESLAADLTSHLIAITTGFNGASVVLFGATDGFGEIVVAVRGPKRPVTVRYKRRILGIWVNTEKLTFGEVPGFYAIAASRPIDQMVSASTAAHYGLAVGNLRLEPESSTPARDAAGFAAALVRQRQQAGLFASSVGKVHFLGERLFRTTIAFPSTVPTGAYRADVYLIRNREVVAERTTPLEVSRVGVDAAVFDFAGRRPGLYGAIAVVTAMVAGWLASLPFRNA